MPPKVDTALRWVTLGGPVIAAIGLLVAMGFCATPASIGKSVEAARAEAKAAIQILTEQQAVDKHTNDKEHEEFRADLKALGERTHETTDQILQLEIQVLKELRSAGNAPTGPVFRRGKQVTP